LRLRSNAGRTAATGLVGVDQLEAQLAQDDRQAGFDDSLSHAADEQELGYLSGSVRFGGNCLHLCHYEQGHGAEERHRGDVVAS
jgi:hypothetical protein